jgi:hypothetical protein
MYNVSIEYHIVKKTELDDDPLGQAIVGSLNGDRRIGQ